MENTTAENAGRQGAENGVPARVSGGKRRENPGVLSQAKRISFAIPPKLYAKAAKAAAANEESLVVWIRGAMNSRLDSEARAERARKSARGGK